MRRILGTLIIMVLIALVAPAVWAHKGKLPEDARTLIRQASALLAQNPGMSGEVRERVQAALRSKQTQGVHMDQVADALRALEGKDVGAARRLLTAAITPAGMPMPPEGPRRTTSPAAGAAPAPVPVTKAAPPASQPSSVDVAMTVAEPLRAGFGGSAAERVLLAFSLALIGLGLTAQWRARKVVGR